MKHKIVGLLVFLIMLSSMIGCALEQSTIDPMYVYISGVSGSGNVTIHNYTTNITESTTSNMTGIVVVDGSNAGVIAQPTGTVVGTTDTQTLSNKTYNGKIMALSDTTSYIESDVLTGDIVQFRLESTGSVSTGLTTAPIGKDTTTVEWFDLGKTSASSGGAFLKSVMEDAAVGTNLLIYAIGGTAETTKSTAGRSLAEIWVTEHDGANNLSNVTANGNVFGIRKDTGTTLIIVDEDGDLWVLGNMSAESITDRTPWFTGDAVDEIKKIKDKDGEVDHSTLPDFTKVIKEVPIYEKYYDPITGITTYGPIIDYEIVTERDIGATISMLCVAIKQLEERIAYLEGKIK